MAQLHFSEKPNQINLLYKEDNPFPYGRKSLWKKFLVYFGVVLVVIFFVFSYEVIFTDKSLSTVWNENLNFWKNLTTIVKGAEELRGYQDDRINIALMGIGGEGHDGPYLADTIMIVSLQPSTKKIAMISIPRDLLVEIPNFGWWKINNICYFDQKENRYGALASQVLSNITGLPIHYYVRINFDGFEKIIDELGGVKINVDRAFTDYSYPAADYKYQTVHFDAGPQTMDGETALKYVRSRHGNNGESGDFARSKRQQKLIQAITERIFASDSNITLKKIANIWNTIGKNIETNFSINELPQISKLARELDTQNIINIVLDDSPDGYLYATKFNEAYVLRPKNNDFSKIQFMAQNIFATQHVITSKISANLEIKNGTTITGLAYKVSQNLKDKGFTILKIGNAPNQTYDQTVIYGLALEKNSATDTSLSNYFKTTINYNPPDWVKDDADLSTHYYIILGKDAIKNSIQ